MSTRHEREHVMPAIGGSLARRPGRSLALRILSVAIDWISVAAAWSVVVLVTEPGRGLRIVGVCTLAVAAHWAAYERAGLYHARVIAERTAELTRILRWTAGAGVAIGLAGRANALDLSPATVVMATLLTLSTVISGRSVLRAWLTTQRTRGRFRRPVLLCGVGPETGELYDLLSQHPELGLDVVALVGDRDAAKRIGLGHLWRDAENGIPAALATTDITAALVTTTAMDPAELNRVTRELLAMGVHVQLLSNVTGFASRRVQVRTLAYRQVIELERLELAPWQVTAKRCSDMVIAAMVLVPASVAIGLCALLIKLTDGGPVLFRQTRVGLNGRPFQVLKLRTMVTDADARRAALVNESNERAGPLFKMDRDPRLTAIGYWLDLTSLNELPQLWNVLKGDMSLVGPRPALPGEHEQFDPALQARTVVRPGITGLWQVEARDNPSFEAYRRFDLHYVENWSLSLDAVILAATAETVIARVIRRVTHRDAPDHQSNPPRRPGEVRTRRNDGDRRQRQGRRRDDP